MLVQQAVNIDFAARRKVNASIDHDRENETRCQSRSIALAVLLRRVDRLCYVHGVEGIKNGSSVVGAVPNFS